MGRKCKFENCETYASFGYEYKKALYCKPHKLDDMHNVNNRYCVIEKCIT